MCVVRRPARHRRAWISFPRPLSNFRSIPLGSHHCENSSGPATCNKQNVKFIHPVATCDLRPATSKLGLVQRERPRFRAHHYASVIKPPEVEAQFTLFVCTPKKKRVEVRGYTLPVSAFQGDSSDRFALLRGFQMLKKNSSPTGSNHGPQDLQSYALPLRQENI